MKSNQLLSLLVLALFKISGIASVCHPKTELTTPKTEDFVVMSEGSEPLPCVLMSLGVYIKVGADKYIQANNGKLDTKSSGCPSDKNPASVSIDYECLKLNILIHRKAAEQTISVASIKSRITTDKDARVIYNDTEGLFDTKYPNHAYRCNGEQSLLVNREDNYSLVFRDLHIEAYRDPSKKTYYLPEDHCEIDEKNRVSARIIYISIIVVAFVAVILLVLYGIRLYMIKKSEQSQSGLI